MFDEICIEDDNSNTEDSITEIKESIKEALGDDIPEITNEDFDTLVDAINNIADEDDSDSSISIEVEKSTTTETTVNVHHNIDKIDASESDDSDMKLDIVRRNK